jgi:hypothetical protein
LVLNVHWFLKLNGFERKIRLPPEFAKNANQGGAPAPEASSEETSLIEVAGKRKWRKPESLRHI